MDPVSSTRGQTSRRNYAVDVRMMEKVLTPGMEYRKEADFGPQMLGVGGYLQKSFGTGAEQEVIEDFSCSAASAGKVGEAE